MLKITLVKSVIGSKPRNRKTVVALGLKKTGRTVYREDTPSIRGMVHNVQHLVTVEEVDAAPDAPKKAIPKAKAAPKTEVKTEKAPAKKAPAKKAEAKTEEKPKKSPAKKAAPKKEAGDKKPAAKKSPAKKTSSGKRTFAEIGKDDTEQKDS